MHGPRRALLALSLLAGAVALGVAATGPAEASAPAVVGSPCSNAADITVVVDFQGLGGGVRVGCAAQPVSTGFDALEKAGFQVTHVSRFSGALCKIDGKPTDQACGNMPPATAYWSYWVASRGGAWCYSNLGPSRKPPPGTVEGWSFAQDSEDAGSTPRPGYGPPSAIPGTTPNTVGRSSCPTEPSTTTTTSATSPNPGGGGGGGGTAGGSSTGGSTTGGSTTGGSTSGGSTGSGTGGGTTGDGTTGGGTTGSADPGDPSAPTTSSSALEGVGPGADGSSSSTGAPDAHGDAKAGDLTTEDRDDGSPLGVAAGVGGALALGGLALVTARRRRRDEAAPDLDLDLDPPGP